MLSISKPKKAGQGAGYYFNYYERDAVTPILVFGKGAELFGLKDTLTRKQFTQLFNGFSPDGKTAFVKNAGDAGRQAFWDLTLSVPKSVSVLWMAASPETQKSIEEVILDTVKRTLALAEERYGLSRRGAGGREWVPAALTFALFQHIQSRENQTQLHWHCLLFNLGIQQDGKVATLQTTPLFDAKLSLGTSFSHDLALGLEQRLGVITTKEKVGFHVEGVPKDLCEKNSKRRQQITEYLKDRGLSGGKAAKTAALKTRRPKTNTPKDELKSIWRKDAAEDGWTQEKAESLICIRPQPQIVPEIEKSKKHDKSSAPEINTAPQKDDPRAEEKQKAPQTLEELHYARAKAAGWSDENLRRVKERAEKEWKHYESRTGREREWKDERDTASDFAQEFRADQEKEKRAPDFDVPPNANGKSSGNDSKDKSSDEKQYEKRRSRRPDQDKYEYGKALKAFREELREKTDRIYPEHQTRKKIERIAFAIGKTFGTKASDILAAVDDLKLPIHGKFYRVEWRRVFPKAPKWNKLGQVRIPRIVLRNNPHKWGKIHYSKPIWAVLGPKKEIRIQQRYLFPKAPAWSPISQLSLKAIRIAPYREYAAKEAAKKKREEREKRHQL